MNKPTTFCPRCRKVMPVEAYLDSDQCPECGQAFHTDTCRIAVGFAFLVSLGFLGLAAFSADPQRWKFAIFISAATGVWSVMVILTELSLKKFTRLPNRERSRLAMPLASVAFLLLLFLLGR